MDRTWLLAVLVSAGISGCGGDAAPASVPGSGGVGGGGASVAASSSSGGTGAGAVVGAGGGAGGSEVGCTASDCLYAPDATYTVSMHVPPPIVYTDVLGEARTVPIAVYVPTGAPEPLPIVVLSHGGANGVNDPTKVLDGWAPLVAGAGYVAIAVAHAGRAQASYDALCQYVGADPSVPCALKINWDRPLDVASVLDWLEAQGGKVGTSTIDTTRIAHFGHSAGAGCAMMVGGAPRNYVCGVPFGQPTNGVVCDPADLLSRKDARVKAIVALSPQGPGSDGFMDASYPPIDVPMLMGTGLDDGDPGEPENRLALFPLLSTGHKYLVYVDDPGANHPLFGSETDACEKVQTPARCAEMIGWLHATALAFLDGEVRGSSRAMAWLGSSSLEAASAGSASWTSK